MDNGLIGIVSDIHGNEEAFKAVLRYLRGLGVERILCLGDLVGYGQGAWACVGLAEKYRILSIQGNHDAQVSPPRDPRMRKEACAALDHAERDLTKEQREMLRNLPHTRTVDEHLLLVHGSLRDRDEYIMTKEVLQANIELLKNTFSETPIAFYGHTHLPLLAGIDAKGGITVRMNFAESTVIDLDPGKSYLINPGSVGQPRDGTWLASFATYERATHQLTIIRLEYDIETEQERMRKVGLPARLWERLAEGR